MMRLLRPLFEAWLLEAPEAGLPAWKRACLGWALRRDPELAALALELAEFLHGAEPEAPDLRGPLRARLGVEQRAAESAWSRSFWPESWPPGWALAAVMMLALLALWFRPERAPEAPELARARSEALAGSLALPTPTPSPSPSPHPQPTAPAP